LSAAASPHSGPPSLSFPHPLPACPPRSR
jgi:hypothetical protein